MASNSANTSQIPTDGSLVWYFFVSPIIKDGKRKVKYHLCTEKEIYLILSQGFNSSLCSNITNIHHINIAEAVSSGNFPVVLWSGENVFRQVLVKWIATNGLPFITVESESFRELANIIRKLDNNVTIPFASTITEDWEVKSQVLNLAPFNGVYTRINMANTLFSICNDFSINNKIFGVVIDNASSNNTLLEAFESLCNNSGSSFIKQEGHICCMAHIINLALQGFLSHLHLEAPE